MWPTPTPIPIIVETPSLQIPFDGQGMAASAVGGWQYIDNVSGGMLNTIQIVVLVIIVLIGLSLIMRSMKDLDNE